VSTLIDMARLTVEEGWGIATFEAVEVHSAYVARYLKLNDRRTYEVGNGCGTCQFWFTRLEGATGNVAVDELRDRLAHGLSSASDLPRRGPGRVVPGGSRSPPGSALS
jgi:hypothetical protein